MFCFPEFNPRKQLKANNAEKTISKDIVFFFVCGAVMGIMGVMGVMGVMGIIGVMGVMGVMGGLGESIKLLVEKFSFFRV